MRWFCHRDVFSCAHLMFSVQKVLLPSHALLFLERLSWVQLQRLCELSDPAGRVRILRAQHHGGIWHAASTGLSHYRHARGGPVHGNDRSCCPAHCSRVSRAVPQCNCAVDVSRRQCGSNRVRRPSVEPGAPARLRSCSTCNRRSAWVVVFKSIRISPCSSPSYNN